MTASTISAIIPVYNGLPELRACLDSILAAATRHGSTEVVVVDNGSTDGTLAVLDEYRHRPALRILTHPRISIGAVRNLGARSASGTILAFIDSDCVIGTDHFVHMEDLILRQGVSVTGLRVGLPQDPHWVEATWHELHDRWVDAPPYINSGNLAVTRSAYQAVGGFAEDLTTGEDAEFCARLARAGFPSQPSRLLGVQHLRNPQSVQAFFRKETWRGLGMFGTFRHSWIDKPLLMTFAHGGLLVGALLVLTLLQTGWLGRLALAAGMVWLVPTAAVVYRFVETRRVTSPVPSLMLYQAYFLARLVALLWLASGAGHGKQFGTGHAGGIKRSDAPELSGDPEGLPDRAADTAPM